MRALRVTPLIGFALALAVSAPVSAFTPVYDLEDTPAVQAVSGSVVLDEALTRGYWSTQDRVFQHREVPRTGSPMIMSDPRITGRLASTWNWDVHTSGQQPVPAWGTMRIDVPALTTIEQDGTRVVQPGLSSGAWVGDFTGIRHADGEPFQVRALLFGEGAYDGLCATLDIEAGEMAWLADGVIHPAMPE